MWRKIVVIIFFFIVLGVSFWYLYSAEEEDSPEAGETEERVESEEKEKVKEGESYKAAEEVVPDGDLHIALHEDFRIIFKEVFGKEPKLTSVGEVNILSYVTNRTINVEDINKAGNILQEEEYKIIGRTFSDNEEGIRLSAEINGEEYDNIYILFFTHKEGVWAQRIEVSLL